jgi:c-di-GMP-binding flagellar brake protein YcgR
MTSNLKERRRHPRLDNVNLVNYALFDISGQKIEGGKGRTINLSQSGTLLETDKELLGSFVILMTIDLGGEQVKVQGRVVHNAHEEVSGNYLTGIEFMGAEDRQREAIVAFIKSQEHREASGQIKK